MALQFVQVVSAQNFVAPALKGEDDCETLQGHDHLAVIDDLGHRVSEQRNEKIQHHDRADKNKEDVDSGQKPRRVDAIHVEGDVEEVDEDQEAVVEHAQNIAELVRFGAVEARVEDHVEGEGEREEHDPEEQLEVEDVAEEALDDGDVVADVREELDEVEDAPHHEATRDESAQLVHQRHLKHTQNTHVSLVLDVKSSVSHVRSNQGGCVCGTFSGRCKFGVRRLSSASGRTSIGTGSGPHPCLQQIQEPSGKGNLGFRRSPTANQRPKLQLTKVPHPLDTVCFSSCHHKWQFNRFRSQNLHV